ncbi:radical SAM-linked protein [Thermosyntropha lipolytica DSM 11003]|uniref:Radical SAM-linked protein n=1 Tax=Thermosyntropha lipolytica DSM 11003 TaxID=1123382 RepID=A0A1M5M500_9FIRM|nr:TIGR03936 family radical SAM-associated protein [Thermosyntropha lipolytica]SHG72394.1 radical SAM-linked protein [Thermosyntropha lipolytica DSM 11003]
MRLRAEYRLGPDLRFLSNLEMMRLMERALRRSSLPYALTEGFNPHIKLSLGTVLPVGLWGMREYMDVEMAENIGEEYFKERMNEVLPEGVRINKARIIPEEAPSLMKIINSASYTFVLRSGYDWQEWQERIWQAERLPVKSRGKKKDAEKDLRAGIFKIETSLENELAFLNIWVATGDPVNVRYDELHDLLTITGIAARDIIDVYRSGNYIKEGDFFYTPLEKVI